MNETRGLWAAALLDSLVPPPLKNAQVLVFNYASQAGCRFPVPTPEEAKHQDPGAVSLNNEWVAERLHELLVHVEATGDTHTLSEKTAHKEDEDDSSSNMLRAMNSPYYPMIHEPPWDLLGPKKCARTAL